MRQGGFRPLGYGPAPEFVPALVSAGPRVLSSLVQDPGLAEKAAEIAEALMLQGIQLESATLRVKQGGQGLAEGLLAG